jgi:hypothetical protein
VTKHSKMHRVFDLKLLWRRFVAALLENDRIISFEENYERMLFPLCRWIVETFDVCVQFLLYPFYNYETLYRQWTQSSNGDGQVHDIEEDFDPMDMKKRIVPLYSRLKYPLPGQLNSPNYNQPVNHQYDHRLTEALPRPYINEPHTGESTRRRGSHNPVNNVGSSPVLPPSFKTSPEPPRHTRKHLHHHNHDIKHAFVEVVSEPSLSHENHKRRDEVAPSLVPPASAEKTMNMEAGILTGGIKGSHPLVTLDRFTLLATAKPNATTNMSNNTSLSTQVEDMLQQSSSQGYPIYSPVVRERKHDLTLPTIAYTDITYIQAIGTGGFGQVWKGLWKGTPVAVKTLNQVCQANVPDKVLFSFEEEVSMLARLRHPNICLLLGVSLEPSHRLIVTELVSRGSLWDVLRVPGLFQVSLFCIIFMLIIFCFRDYLE